MTQLTRTFNVVSRLASSIHDVLLVLRSRNTAGSDASSCAHDNRLLAYTAPVKRPQGVIEACIDSHQQPSNCAQAQRISLVNPAVQEAGSAKRCESETTDSHRLTRLLSPPLAYTSTPMPPSASESIVVAGHINVYLADSAPQHPHTVAAHTSQT
jgi:hypothetical protein